MDRIDYFKTVKADVSLIPEHMREGLLRYVEQGIAPGSFLEAVLCNNLKEAVSSADHINIKCLPDWITFLHNYVPASCWGSIENYEAWVKTGGIYGRES